MMNERLVIVASLFGVLCLFFCYDTWKLSQEVVEPKQQLEIIRLSYFKNVTVTISPIRIFHYDPQILVDEIQFSHMLKGNGYLLHESESVVISFKNYQIVNMIRIIIKQNDDYQAKKILVYGIYRNSDFLLIDTRLLNNEVVRTLNYLKIFLFCRAPLCKNQYNGLRFKFQGSNETVQIYPIVLYYVNDFDRLDDLSNK